MNPGSLLFCMVLTALGAACLKQGDVGLCIFALIFVLFESRHVFNDEPDT